MSNEKSRIFVATAEVFIDVEGSAIDSVYCGPVTVQVLVNEWPDGSRTVALRQGTLRSTTWGVPATLEEER